MTPILLTDGDILDRLSILNVKRLHEVEVDYLPFDRYVRANPDYVFDPLYLELEQVNMKLWDLEDAIREAHSARKLTTVMELSRNIIDLNKTRSEIKSKIDGKVTEHKKYAGG